MARPQKAGLDYFPLNCTFDDSLELIIAEFGLTGLGVIVRLYQKIYSGKGYYCEWNDDVALLFSRNNGVGGNVVSEVINACFRRSVFDKKIYDKHSILTSKGIQSRYFEAVSRRSKIEIVKEYLLIDTPSNIVNVNNNSVNVNNNSQIVNDNTQSKVKESKVNKSKVKESKAEEIAKEYGIDFSSYSDEEKNEPYPLDNKFTTAEYLILSELINDLDLTRYFGKLKKYPNCENAFLMVVNWAKQDGNIVRGGKNELFER